MQKILGVYASAHLWALTACAAQLCLHTSVQGHILPALRGVYCNLKLLPAEIKYLPCEITVFCSKFAAQGDPWYQPISLSLVVTLLLHNFLRSAQRDKDALRDHNCPGLVDGAATQKISLEEKASPRWPVGSPTFMKASAFAQARALKTPWKAAKDGGERWALWVGQK